jgi:hypothetical protein
VVDASGNVTAIWSQFDTTNLVDDIWANRFTGSAWGTAEKVDSDDSGYASVPKVGVDSSGNVTVAWRQSDGSQDHIWANRFTGSAWGTAQQLETNDGNARDPSLVVDSSGNVVVLWEQEFQDTGTNDLWSATYTSSWSTAATIESGSGNLGYETLGVSGGTAVAAWWQHDGTTWRLWVSLHSGGTWGTATQFTSGQSNPDLTPIVTGPSGAIAVIWGNRDTAVDSHVNIQARQYTSGAWGSVQAVETDTAQDGSTPVAVSDSSGNITAIWRHYDGSRYNLWANRFE